MGNHKKSKSSTLKFTNFKADLRILYTHIHEWKWDSMVSIVNMPLTGQEIVIPGRGKRYF
jgi:hypothetical protein